MPPEQAKQLDDVLRMQVALMYRATYAKGHSGKVQVRRT
jgi:hypothetical protein